MLKEKGLLSEYWEVNVAKKNYFIHRSPTKVVHDKIQLKAWERHRWIVEHLRVFGCVVYAHLPKKKRQKLDDKT